MRPLNKPKVGQTTPTGEVISNHYQPYTAAKPHLVSSLGKYCCYCEVHEQTLASIHVEHIKPKSRFPRLKTAWVNFMIACHTCNTVEKGEKVPNLNELLLPLRDDTYHAISYGYGGYVSVNTNLDTETQRKAQALIDLVGLHKRPGLPGLQPSDKRWENRYNAWDIAVKYRAKLQNGQVDAETIVDLAIPRGFWSVWMNVFRDHPEVVNGLIAWVGTRWENHDT